MKTVTQADFEAVNPRPCKRCREAGQPENFASPRTCAFNTDTFDVANWNCETMNALRPEEFEGDAAPPHTTILWNDDQNACVVKGTRGGFVLLSWYKRRGRTEGAWQFHGTEQPRQLTLQEAELILEGRFDDE